MFLPRRMLHRMIMHARPLAEILRLLILEGQTELIVSEVEDPIERFEVRRLLDGAPLHHQGCLNWEDVEAARNDGEENGIKLGMDQVLGVLAATHPDLATQLDLAMKRGLGAMEQAS